MENPSSSHHAGADDRRPSPRPQSTMALDFSDALDGAFNMNGDLLELGTKVEEKKQTVKSQSQELEELEARIKATEERLKGAGGQPPTSGSQQQHTSHAASSTRPMPSSSSSQAIPSRVPPRGPGASLVAASVSDRAPTPLDPSRNEAMPGALPETRSDRKTPTDHYNQRRS